MTTRPAGFLQTAMLARARNLLGRLRRLLLSPQQLAALEAAQLARSQDRVVEKYLQAKRLN